MGSVRAMGSPAGRYPQPRALPGLQGPSLACPSHPWGLDEGVLIPSSCIRNSWERRAQANRCSALCNDHRPDSTPLPAAALHSPALGMTCSTGCRGRGGHGLPKPLSSTRHLAVLRPGRGPAGTHDQMV